MFVFKFRKFLFPAFDGFFIVFNYNFMLLNQIFVIFIKIYLFKIQHEHLGPEEEEPEEKGFQDASHCEEAQ